MGAFAIWVVKMQPPAYEAQVRLLVGPGIDGASPDLDMLRTGGELMGTYAELVFTDPILEAAIKDLQLDASPEDLGNKLSIRTSASSQVLRLKAFDQNPAQAINIANTLANKLVEISPSGPDSPESLIKANMHSQAERLEKSINASEARIENLETYLQAISDDEEQRRIIEQISAEGARLSESQSTLAGLYATLQRTATNQVRVIEPALNAELVDPQLQIKVLIGALSGLVLGFVIAYGLEQVSDRVEDRQQLAEVADAPVLGEITRGKKTRRAWGEQLVVQALPISEAAESYRRLGARLLLTKNRIGLRSFLVTSPHMDQDIGAIVTNLAVTLAQAGSKVVLVDANFRHPSITPIFRPNGEYRLADIIAGNQDRAETAIVNQIPRLSIMTSGSASNPKSQLASARMTRLIRQLEEQADVVLLACSPPTPFDESLILGSHVGGAVIAVRKGKTRLKVVQEMVAYLRMLNIRIIGTVLDDERMPAARSIRWRPRGPGFAGKVESRQKEAAWTNSRRIMKQEVLEYPHSAPDEN